MARWAVLVNHAAGRRPVSPAWVAGILRSESVEAELLTPATPDESIQSIQDAARAGVTHFAVVGGDGTVNLAANALLSLDLGFRPVIGVLPTGSGCDLLRTFGVPQDLARAARHLAGDETYVMDVGVLEGEWGLRHFVNVAQAGVGAAAADTATHLPRVLGAARYPLAFAVRLPRFPRAAVRLTTERRTIESNALAVIMANAQFFAGGWNVAPKATVVDGVFDIQVISPKKTEAPALVPKVIKGTHLTDPSVRRISAAEFTLETTPGWPVECDGDVIGNTTVKGRVLPAAISLKI